MISTQYQIELASLLRNGTLNVVKQESLDNVDDYVPKLDKTDDRVGTLSLMYLQEMYKHHRQDYETNNESANGIEPLYTVYDIDETSYRLVVHEFQFDEDTEPRYVLMRPDRFFHVQPAEISLRNLPSHVASRVKWFDTMLTGKIKPAIEAAKGLYGFHHAVALIIYHVLKKLNLLAVEDWQQLPEWVDFLVTVEVRLRINSLIKFETFDLDPVGWSYDFAAKHFQDNYITKVDLRSPTHQTVTMCPIDSPKNQTCFSFGH